MLCTVAVTKEKALEIVRKSLLQSKEPEWYQECSKGIASSMFGKVIKRRQNIYPTSVINYIVNRNYYSTMPPSLGWELEKESIAVDSYVNHLQDELQVRNCGLVICPQFPWLGCSSDG